MGLKRLMYCVIIVCVWPVHRQAACSLAMVEFVCVVSPAAAFGTNPRSLTSTGMVRPRSLNRATSR